MPSAAPASASSPAAAGAPTTECTSLVTTRHDPGQLHRPELPGRRRRRGGRVADRPRRDLRALRGHVPGAAAKVRIDTIKIIDSNLPRRQIRLVLAWAELHQEELEENWRQARSGGRLFPIEPLP
ncbi:MAG: DUF4160 domain-containing protein [Actinobacteria bacterium]|nr:DUF4160 domain-containing protein [Actinomycetota bacterium]